MSANAQFLTQKPFLSWMEFVRIKLSVGSRALLEIKTYSMYTVQTYILD